MRRNHSYNTNDRPGSSSSNHTKKTPSSSGASIISGTSSTPRANRTAGSGSGSIGGGNSLLQERLRERKVESSRSSIIGERGVQSSPVRGNTREERRPSSGVSGKAMGVKQIEEVGLFSY